MSIVEHIEDFVIHTLFAVPRDEFVLLDRKQPQAKKKQKKQKSKWIDASQNVRIGENKDGTGVYAPRPYQYQESIEGNSVVTKYRHPGSQMADTNISDKLTAKEAKAIKKPGSVKAGKAIKPLFAIDPYISNSKMIERTKTIKGKPKGYSARVVEAVMAALRKCNDIEQ